MTSKYAIQKLLGGWAVTMSANGHLIATGFDSEEAAALARDQFERGERTIVRKRDVWVIGETFVCESELGGKLIGEVRKLDMNQYHVAERYTQAEFDQMMEDYKDEEGDYPDT